MRPSREFVEREITTALAPLIPAVVDRIMKLLAVSEVVEPFHGKATGGLK